ncbi:MAG: 50S ribosomal protein L2 [Thermoplasmatales archaeon]
MGKKLLVQRRGRGGLMYKSPSHRHYGDIKYPNTSSWEGRVVKLLRDPGHYAPVAQVRMNDDTIVNFIAHSGMFIGQKIQGGKDAVPIEGNTLPLGLIPDGALVYNVEVRPGSGGNLSRTPGAFCTVVSHGENVTIKLPSGKLMDIKPSCLATIGVVGGGGRNAKPFLKAGKKIHAYQSRAKRPFSVRGVAMNAVNHPHGGGNHQHVGRPSTVGRNTPPGRKVGRISPKRKVRKNA